MRTRASAPAHTPPARAVHPYVLLNYTGTLDSQFTLAHEMGHAIHSYLSNHTRTRIDADYVIFVAEVASTCNEALLMEHLLGQDHGQEGARLPHQPLPRAVPARRCTARPCSRSSS